MAQTVISIWHHIFFLVFLDCAKIIDKGKCTLIFWIDITLRACIAGAKVAARIIRRQRFFCGCFLLAPIVLLREVVSLP